MKSIFPIIITAFFFLGAYDSNVHRNYFIGCIIAFLIMGYLIYSLIRPEKF